MAIRSRDFVGIAEGIKSHELSTKGKIEQLKGRISELSRRKSSLNGTISYLEAAIAAAYEDTDEDGDPDYGLIASLEAEKGSAENELSGVEQDLDSTGGELEQSENELESVLEEKAQTLFEIQERARTTSKNIALAGGMYGAYSGVGGTVQNSMQTSLSALSQAASILGGSVDGNGSAGNGNTTSGAGNSASLTGSNPQSELSTSPLAAFAGGETSEGSVTATNPPASQFSSGQTENSTPGTLPNFHSGQTTINAQKPQNFDSTQDANDYASGSFSGNESTFGTQASIASTSYQSTQTSAAIEQALAGERGSDSGTAVPSSAVDALSAYMQANNYGKDDFAVYSKDPEWQRLHMAAYPDSQLIQSLSGSTLAEQQLRDYMSEHNYGLGDFPTYSMDPEWQRLHQMAYPDSGVIGSLIGSSIAIQRLQNFMNSHNYGVGDYPTYSKDPEWQRLQRMAYPQAGKRILFKTNHHHSKGETATWNGKLGDRAQTFFSSFFAPDSGQRNTDIIGSGLPSKPINQILANAIPAADRPIGGESIHQQFADLKKIEVNNLSKENLHTIVGIAVQNLRTRYGDREASARFDTIGKKISFINDKQVRRELGRYYSSNICGYYSPSSDTIRINMDGNATVGDILATIDHEAMHLLSKHSKSQGGVLNSNIVYNNVGMNEGITEMLSIKNMQSINPDYVSNSYRDEVEIMRQFESVCGEKQLLDAYMKNDTSQIASEFNRLMGNQKAFEKFCNDIDVLHYYNYTNSRAVDAPIQRMNAKARIYQKLDQYRKAKMESGELTTSHVDSGRNLRQYEGKDSPINLQLRFGLGQRNREDKTRNISDASIPTVREKRASFVSGLYGGRTLEQQAEDARRRKNTDTAGTPDNDDDPYKEERQRSRPEDREI